MNSTPEISGYEFDQRLLRHPLAELWRGRSFTGMEVVALVLSEAGAKDAVVRETPASCATSIRVARGAGGGWVILRPLSRSALLASWPDLSALKLRFDPNTCPDRFSCGLVRSEPTLCARPYPRGPGLALVARFSRHPPGCTSRLRAVRSQLSNQS